MTTNGMHDFDTVRKIGLSLPDVVDGTAYGARALKLGDKLLACIPTNKSAEANCAVVRIDLERRAELLQQKPEIYYITDHYAPHPTVLVRLSRITRTELAQLLHEAWRFVRSSNSAHTASSTRRSDRKPPERMSGTRKNRKTL